MLDFPSSPNVGDTLRGPRGQAWVWTGTVWTALTAVDPLTLDQPVLNQPRIKGVTDGSNAQPGEVGEFIEATFATRAIGAASYLIVGAMTLSAGDWDVEGTSSINGYGSTVQLIISTSGSGSPTVLNNNRTQITTYSSPTIAAILVTPVIRFNMAVQTPVYLWAYNSVAGTVDGYMRARRMR